MKPAGKIVFTGKYDDRFKQVVMPLCDYTPGTILEVKEGSKVTTVVLEDVPQSFLCDECFFRPSSDGPGPRCVECGVCTEDRWFPCVYTAMLCDIPTSTGIRFRSLGSVMEEL